MGEWKECKLGDVMIFGNGKERPKTEGIYPIYGGNGILGYCDQFNFQDEIIIIGRVGAYCGSLFYEDKRIWISDNALSAKPKGRNDIKFLFYFLKNLKLNQFAEGSSHPLLTQTLLNSIEITIPESESEQRAIASVLSSLDDKIDLLDRENQTLEQMAEALFRQWFIEEADEQWEEVTLGDFFPVITGEKDANFATDDGSYPFFTCSKRTLWAPTYSFDGPAILLAGNGDFNIKHCVGKFEAYQRTYVLIPYDPVYFGFLLTLMKYYLSEITSGHQGSVIDFITKPMIKSFTFLLPKHRDSIQDNLVYLNELYKKIDINSSQILTLEKLRDTLLPKLMSGEVRVKL